MHGTRSVLTLLRAALVAGAVSFGCDGRPPAATPEGLMVAATTAQVAQLAQAIAGDAVRVVQVIPTPEDPHRFSPVETTADVLAAADLILYNGHHLEGQLLRVLEALAARKPVIAIAERIDQNRILVESGAADHTPDPHLWHDPIRWGEAAGVVAAALTSLMPEEADGFRARLDAYRADLVALHAELRARIETIPAAGRVLVTAHDAFQYFGDSFGMHVEAIQGLSTEIEASPQDIEQVVQFLVDRQVPAVFVEATISNRTVRALIRGADARGHTVVEGGTLYSDTLGPDGSPAGTYAGMLRHNVETIVAALAPTPTATRSGSGRTQE